MNGTTKDIADGVYVIGHPNIGYCVFCVRNNETNVIEVGGVTLSDLNVTITKVNSNIFRVSYIGTSGAARRLKPIYGDFLS